MFLSGLFSGERNPLSQIHPFLMVAHAKHGLCTDPKTGNVCDLTNLKEIELNRLLNQYRLFRDSPIQKSELQQTALQIVCGEIFIHLAARFQEKKAPVPLSIKEQKEDWSTQLQKMQADKESFLDSLQAQWERERAAFMVWYKRELTGQQDGIRGVKRALMAVARKAGQGQAEINRLAAQPRLPIKKLTSFVPD
jgi:hypothetical protein